MADPAPVPGPTTRSTTTTTTRSSSSTTTIRSTRSSNPIFARGGRLPNIQQRLAVVGTTVRARPADHRARGVVQTLVVAPQDNILNLPVETRDIAVIDLSETLVDEVDEDEDDAEEDSETETFGRRPGPVDEDEDSETLEMDEDVEWRGPGALLALPQQAGPPRPRPSAGWPGPVNTSEESVNLWHVAENEEEQAVPATPSGPLDTTIDLTDSPPPSPQSPDSPYTGPLSAIQCPVCLDSLAAVRRRGRTILSTTCGHVFCSACLPRAVAATGRCPACRTRLGTASYHNLYLA